MFFLGISAHILIYLLVPAFLIVCLISNGKPDTLEVADFLPVCIMHEPQEATINATDTYVYGVTEYIASEEKEEFTFPTFITLVEFLDVTEIYYSPGISDNSLRAPPAMILGC